MTIEDEAQVDVAVENRGTLVFGSSPGQATVRSFEQSGEGRLEIEIESFVSIEDHDHLTVTDTATLDGTLGLVPGSGRDVTYGDSILILSAGNIDGAFAKFTGASVNDEITLAPIYSSNALMLVPALPADANLDQVVNFDDFVILTNNFEVATAGAVWENADFNLDGITNFDDFVILTNNFNKTVDSSSSASIPEPTALYLTCLGVLMTVMKRRDPGTGNWISGGDYGTGIIQGRPAGAGELHA